MSRSRPFTTPELVLAWVGGATAGLAILGLLIVFLVTRDDWEIHKTWTKTTCTIVSAAVVTDDSRQSRDVHHAEVVFRHAGHLIKGPERDVTWYRSRADAESGLAGFNAGDTVPCYIRPGHPDEGVLRHAFEEPAFTFGVPGGVALVGLLVLAAVLLRRAVG